MPTVLVLPRTPPARIKDWASPPNPNNPPTMLPGTTRTSGRSGLPWWRPPRAPGSRTPWPSPALSETSTCRFVGVRVFFPPSCVFSPAVVRVFRCGCPCRRGTCGGGCLHCANLCRRASVCRPSDMKNKNSTSAVKKRRKTCRAWIALSASALRAYWRARPCSDVRIDPGANRPVDDESFRSGRDPSLQLPSCWRG